MIRPSMRMLWIGIAVLALIVAALPAFAQSEDAAPNPNATITWPPPVYVVRGDVDIRGSANVPNMTTYFISFRPLNDDFTPATEQFLPAILPQTAAVQDDVLGTWDTSIIDDGLYELRLTVNARGAQPVIEDIGPIRVENIVPPFVVIGIPADEEQPEVIIITQPPPIVAVTPTPTFDPTPRATVRGATANVRSGDSTDYAVITSLGQGQSVVITGISNRGTGWFQVRLADGRTGWMAPSVVTTSGNLSSLPAVQPPPLPATPTPLPPTVTPTPASSANLVAGVVVFDPSSPTCAQTFNVGFDVANLGTTQTLASGTVSLTDVRAADGSVQGTTVGGFPVLLPGQTFRVNMPLTISTWYNETHRITLVIDASNSIPENNKSDNQRVVEYVLQKGACP
jgi:uncharacterized protein YgiM (DUF1202 family)